jgi:hypothetical protein
MGERKGRGAAPSPHRRREWAQLSDREKLTRLERDIAFSEQRAEEYEQDLVEAESRLRLVFRDVGRHRRRLEELRRNARREERDGWREESLPVDEE